VGNDRRPVAAAISAITWTGKKGPERDVASGLKTVDLDGLGIKLKTLLLVGQELLDILALVSLKLNHLTHLGVIDDGAIAS
jgi:hypothetical protein